MKTEKDIKIEIDNTIKTIENYRKAYKECKIPKNVFQGVMTENRAILTTLHWVLGNNEGWD